METVLERLLKKWPANTALVPWRRPVLVISKTGLDRRALIEIQKDLVDSAGENLFSVITSLKMMHVYFRWRAVTYDYRPHRGAFSKLSVADYRIGMSDRSEILLSLGKAEVERFAAYVVNIRKSPRQTLGRCWPLQVSEPDFTVKSYRTERRLNDNKLLDPNDRHNCLTWFSTAPVGGSFETMLELLEMSDADLEAEAHSYIVAFYRYLILSAPKARVPGLVFWTSDPVAKAVAKIETQSDTLLEFYSPPT